jgi:hypothetical protein
MASRSAQASQPTPSAAFAGHSAVPPASAPATAPAHAVSRLTALPTHRLGRAPHTALTPILADAAAAPEAARPRQSDAFAVTEQRQGPASLALAQAQDDVDDDNVEHLLASASEGSRAGSLPAHV